MTPHAAVRSIATSDPDAGVRRLLIERAAKVFSPEIVTPLLDLDDAPMRNAAADVLVESGGAAVAALHEVAIGGSSRAAQMAVQALTRIGTPAAAEAIIAALESASDVDVLHAAIEGAAVLNVSAAGPRLRSLMNSDGRLSFAAATALEVMNLD